MNSTRLILAIVFGLTTLSSYFVDQPVAHAQQADDTPVVHAVLFFSPSCYHCHRVMIEVLQPLVETHGPQLQIVAVDTTQAEGARLYEAAIEQFQIPSNRRGVPTLIIGNTVLVGSREIPEQFPTLVQEGLEAGGVAWPDFPALTEALAGQSGDSPAPTSSPTTAAPPSPTLQPTATPTPVATAAPAAQPTATVPPSPTPNQLVAANSSSRQPPVYLAYFYDPTCLECARVSSQLKTLEQHYPNLVIHKYNLREQAALNEAMCDKFSVPPEYRLAAPMIFIGDKCLTPDEISESRLEQLIEEPGKAGLLPPWANLETAQTAAAARIVERFKEFGLLAVAGAGLLDGVNPCAFTTIIFFVSYLALVGRRGSEILLVGAAFTLAIFLTYLAMGLGLAEAFRQMSSFAAIGRIIYGLMALLCLILAVMSLVDYFKIRRGQLSEISLQLPKSLKQRIHRTIRTSSRVKGFVGAAFGAGVLVSIFELACTGQVYLPTIVFVSSIAELRLTAFIYLIVYNFMFVVPLIIVFVVTYLGMSSKRLTQLFQANAGTVKLLTAGLFGLLGIWLAYLVLTPSLLTG